MVTDRSVLLIGLDRETRARVSAAIAAVDGLRPAPTRAWMPGAVDPETLVVVRAGLLSGGDEAGGDCDAIELLTERQREVAARVADGRTNREIADELDLSPYTVRNYLARVMDRLGARNRVGIATLIARCLQRLDRLMA